MKVLIYDRRTAVLPLTSDDESDIVTSFVVLHGPTVVRGFVALFETLWEQATPVPLAGDPRLAPSASHRGPLSPVDLQVLQPLAARLADRHIADQLRIGERSLSRRIGRILRALRVTTRFQAGYVTARRDLLDR